MFMKMHGDDYATELEHDERNEYWANVAEAEAEKRLLFLDELKAVPAEVQIAQRSIVNAVALDQIPF